MIRQKEFGHRSKNNTEKVICMLNKKVYKLTCIIFNKNSFLTAKAKRTKLNDTFISTMIILLIASIKI